SADSCGFIPAVGSSSKSSFGSVASARATSRRRWSPYGRFLAASPAFCRSPVNCRSSSPRSRTCFSSRRTPGVRMTELKRLAFVQLGCPPPRREQALWPEEHDDEDDHAVDAGLVQLRVDVRVPTARVDVRVDP